MSKQNNNPFQYNPIFRAWWLKLLQELQKVCKDAAFDKNEPRQIGLWPAQQWTGVRLILKLREQAYDGIASPVVFNLFTPRGRLDLRSWFKIWSEGKESELQGIKIDFEPQGNDRNDAGNAVVFVTDISWKKQDNATITKIVDAFKTLKKWMTDSKLDTVLPKLFS